eukprot:SAG31_NODE_34712_length_330_cov_0.675325_1_plen_49_part_10
MVAYCARAMNTVLRVTVLQDVTALPSIQLLKATQTLTETNGNRTETRAT